MDQAQVVDRFNSSGFLIQPALRSDVREGDHMMRTPLLLSLLLTVALSAWAADDVGPSRNAYVASDDPLGETVSGGLIKAPKITYGKANQMYG